MRIISLGLAALFFSVGLTAVSTEFWKQSTRSDFEKGTRTAIALTNEGRLILAPEVKELKDSSLPYLWTVVEDPRGYIYFAGAGTAAGKSAIHEWSADGKHKVLAELDGYQIQALAMAQDGRLYAATSPDGKVYRVERDGSSREFYDPKSKYIWSLAVDNFGNVFAGTGEKGEVHRISADGKGAIWFDTDEKHARSLAIDRNGNLIVGTEPSGLVIRVTNANQGFVLHQCERSEVTGIAISPDNRIIVGAMGSRGRASGPAMPPMPATPLPEPAKPPAGATAPTRSGAPSLLILFPPTSGGGEVWSIGADGSPALLWEDSREAVYAMAVDNDGKVIAATGSQSGGNSSAQGSLYRIEGQNRWTLLSSLSAAQITGLAVGKSGRLLAVTASTGRLFQVGPELAKEGSFVSEVLDADVFSAWGRIFVRGTAKDSNENSQVQLASRSGNLSRAQKDWSSWQDVATDSVGVGIGGRMASPAARFIQYRVTLKSSAAKVSPQIESVELAYRPKNVTPVIRAVEATLPNYRFPAPTNPLTASRTINLPPIGQTRPSSNLGLSGDGSPTLTFAKGMQSVRWAASDENGDDLLYRVEIKGSGEKNWLLLKDAVRERFLTFDATAFADGEYQVRITATDKPDNVAGEELSSSRESAVFLIDNSVPQISGANASRSGQKTTITWKASDRISLLEKAEYSVNGEEWLPALPTNKVLDSREHEFSVVIPNGQPDRVVAIRVTDSFENQAVEKVTIR
jgi:hypothetical protein